MAKMRVGDEWRIAKIVEIRKQEDSKDDFESYDDVNSKMK